ncbi:MAG: hypothetical protein UV47_C0023G0015 [Parcubacteria group bacterium GW2011_GWA2_42_80]|nr:MAG: hypothetical protein UV47_C0023G0015 [Parcubacteria group bacterium GW2011_GWA2_42_80]KKT17227.1 MAG: hypothetical protein UW00_C0015G0016 [Parcubacteria group bacterium GW2011_GWB1_43_66]
MNSLEQGPSQKSLSLADLMSKEQVSADELKEYFKIHTEYGTRTAVESLFSVIDRVKLTESDISEMISDAEKATEIAKSESMNGGGFITNDVREIEGQNEEIIAHLKSKLETGQQ